MALAPEDRKAFYFDMAERVAWTFVEAFTVTLAASVITDWVTFGQALSLSLMMALVAVVKAFAAGKIGPPTAALPDRRS